MADLRFTLISDGSSDRALVPVLYWLLISSGVARAIQRSWADFAHLRRPPKRLSEKIRTALTYYPCDLLFIHRDSEAQAPDARRREIANAVGQASRDAGHLPPAVCVIPVRMSEAWFLFDEAAIRHAAANPSGRIPLALPEAGRTEGLPNPKRLLHDLLLEASGLSGRRRTRFDAHTAVHRLASIIPDYSPLRALTAFAALEEELRGLVVRSGWNAADQVCDEN